MGFSKEGLGRKGPYSFSEVAEYSDARTEAFQSDDVQLLLSRFGSSLGMENYSD